MKILRMDHVGIVVHDLAAAQAFFLQLGLEVQGETEMEGDWLDRIVGLKDVKTSLVFMGTPGGDAHIELIRYSRPAGRAGIRKPSANEPGIRHIAFEVDDLESVVAGLRSRGNEVFSEIQNYRDMYKLCYIRGPEGIILELAEKIG